MKFLKFGGDGLREAGLGESPRFTFYREIREDGKLGGEVRAYAPRVEPMTNPDGTVGERRIEGTIVRADRVVEPEEFVVRKMAVFVDADDESQANNPELPAAHAKARRDVGLAAVSPAHATPASTATDKK